MSRLMLMWLLEVGLEHAYLGIGQARGFRERGGVRGSALAATRADLTAALASLSEGYAQRTGDKLKRVPKPCDPEHPRGEWLKHMRFHIRIDFPAEVAATDGFVDTILKQFSGLEPVMNFLDEGLST